ncbi:MAG: methyltransferase domain-containing protein [Acidimicrobiales bacterium]
MTNSNFGTVDTPRGVVDTAANLFANSVKSHTGHPSSDEADRAMPLQAGVGFRLSRVARELRRRWADDLSALSVSPPQAAVLRGIAKSPGCSLRALARTLAVDPTNAKRYVDALERRDLIRSGNHTGSRRPRTLTVTEAGKSLALQVDELVRDQEEWLDITFDADERKYLERALDKLEGGLGLAGSRPEPDEARGAPGGAVWDHRYAENPWPTTPDAALEALVTPLSPRDAVDIGCGPGRNAIWLASKGWRVTGVDSSAVGLEQAGERAREAGVDLNLIQADFLEYLARPVRFGLVVIANIHLAPPERRELFAAAAAVVAPGGHLFVVGHHLDSLGRAGPPDPDRLFSEERLSGLFPTLQIERLERYERPNDAGEPPLVDLVLWASRAVTAPEESTR